MNNELHTANDMLICPGTQFFHCQWLQGCKCKGKKGEGESPQPARVLSTQPPVGIWLYEATDPTRWELDKGQPPYQVLSLWHPMLGMAEELRTE